MSFRLLVINPGSTSTRVALFEDENPLWSEEIRHDKKTMQGLGSVAGQKEYRLENVSQALDRSAQRGEVDAVVGRGGLLHPMPGGIYSINNDMLSDLESARYGEHPCNLGAIMAWEFARGQEVPAYVVDPVVTDELDPVARITGLPEITRRCVFHALSQRGAARTAANQMGVRYEDGKFIVAHMGGGVSIGAHDRGRVVEVVNALDGEGPFSPERAGALPSLPALDLVVQGKYTPEQMRIKILREGGLWAHLGTNDLRKAEEMARTDDGARLVLDAMAYNIARYIGSMGPVLLSGEGSGVCAVVLTGGMARSKWLTRAIGGRVDYLGPVVVVTGMEEMLAMAQGGLRALRGEAEVQIYSG